MTEPRSSFAAHARIPTSVVVLELSHEVCYGQCWAILAQRQPRFFVRLSSQTIHRGCFTDQLAHRMVERVSRSCTVQSLLAHVDVLDWMNELQHIPMKKHGPVLVTLNPPFDPDPELVAGKYKYDHPILSLEVCTIHSHRPPSSRHTADTIHTGHPRPIRHSFHSTDARHLLRRSVAQIRLP